MPGKNNTTYKHNNIFYLSQTALCNAKKGAVAPFFINLTRKTYNIIFRPIPLV